MIAEKPAAQKPQARESAQGADVKGRSRVPGALFGLLLFCDAFALALPGMRATTPNHADFAIWAATSGWLIAAGVLVLAAYGLWGFPGLARRWRGLAILGALSSLVFLCATLQWSMWPMMVIDLAIVSLAVDSSAATPPKKRRGIVKGFGFLILQALALALWFYGAGAISLRPWCQQWGATRPEVDKSLPGDADKLHLNALNHVVTIDAAPDKVWPWLAQMGQGKAGFYSYDWLEQALGTNTHSAERLVPQWGQIRVGDFVRACPSAWTGGRWQNLTGWYVDGLQSNRVLELRNWGTFWMEPAGKGKTRFGIRTQVGAPPLWAAPLEVFAFEPAHFVMERKMLLTIKRLSEASAVH